MPERTRANTLSLFISGHIKLMQKLNGYGIEGNLLAWINCFLSQRFQRVKVGAHLSGWSEVTSGVAQGSVLGPILFIIFINDFNSCFTDHRNLFLFADDAKIIQTVKSVADCVQLQSQLDKITKWSSDWQLPLAPSKCKTVTFCKGKPAFNHSYYIDSHPLEKVDKIVDLGIVFCNNLSFDDHIRTSFCVQAKELLLLITAL